MINKHKNIKAFTFIELIIVMVIIVILSWIWFSSYIWYISNARDSQRKSDLLQISSSLKLYKQKRWFFWFPWDYFNLTYDSNIVANQGFLNTSVHIDSIEKLPLDPKTSWYYSYSITQNKQEFLVATTLENEKFNTALVSWNYKSVSKNILPTILIATWAITWTNVEIKDWNINRNLFIFDQQGHNVPYTFINDYAPESDWINFNDLLIEAENNNFFWQNTDYRNCIEIEEAWKLIIPLDSNPFEYQIISNTWALVNTWCTL
jgi:prepilin-type N-terminal cleavage/methylation domain-containing protein